MKVIRRYKEIVFGFLLGVSMWILDAAMHAQLGPEVHSHGFIAELLHPGSTQLIFRSFYVLMATAFGWYLWRSNWRERELRALEDAIIAFHRLLDIPAIRILSQSRTLQGCPCVTRDETAMNIAQTIGDDARLIDELACQYLRFSEQVVAGKTSEAIETLRSIEAWAQKKKALAPSGSSLTVSS